MEDPKPLLFRDPLAYVAREAEAWNPPLRGAWLLGVVSGFLWPEAPPPKDLAALFRRLQGAWREAETYFLETGLDFPLLVSEWAREALEDRRAQRAGPPYGELRAVFCLGQGVGRALKRRFPS
ncbi:hypothetical protein [Thermus sediminis]|uniref:hypothetical protein n=1 Tax=Thermus sediminis TaxID=1761908 RepID=UPI000E3B57ED|nr:hypothetical protein [Thermus sediminis]